MICRPTLRLVVLVLALPAQAAIFIDVPAAGPQAMWTERRQDFLVFRGTRLASGRWLSQPKQAQDAAQEEPGG